MNNNLRLSGHDIENPTAISLCCAVDGLIARASGILEALQIAVENQTAQVEPDVLYNALEAVVLEIRDIQEVTRQFHQAHKTDQ